MKAIVYTKYGSSDVLMLQEVEKPLSKDDEVLIKVHTASVNDWDWALMNGKPLIMRLLGGLFKPKVNILGTDVAGTVEAVGTNVVNFKPGDEVFGDLSESNFGSFAEFVCAKETALTIKPSSMTFEEAAAIPHAATLALQGLRDIGKIQDGQKILINGAGGGLGTLGVQMAKEYDVEITGVDSSDKLDMMRSIGYDHVIAYETVDFTKDGNRYDLILDAKTTRYPSAYLRALSPGGTYVTVGGELNLVFRALIVGKFISMFSRKRLMVLGLKPNKDLDFVNELFEAGKIKPVIDGPYPLNDVPEAIQLFGSGKHKGKIVITI